MVMKRMVKTHDQAPQLHVVAKFLLDTEERMGAWGIATFENDDASDWLYDLEESNGFTILEEALEFDDGYIEAPVACYALAASEVVLALLGRARSGLPETALQWAKIYEGTEVSALQKMAMEAVSRVLSSESELYALWEETEEFESWTRDVEEIASLLANE